MSSETASVDLHGFSPKHSIDPPPYNDVVKLNDLPSAPLLDPPERAVRSDPSFSSIFGAASRVQFEWNSSSNGCSFLIRDDDGSLQAKGDVTSHNTTVHNVNGMEMLKIIERDVNEINVIISSCTIKLLHRAPILNIMCYLGEDYAGNTVRTFSVIHKHRALGAVKVAESENLRTSLQIFDRNALPIVVNSLKIGDYAIFRDNLSSAPLCNIQMPDVQTYSEREFNVKIIFHPQTGITRDEQLLCTAAAIAFKTTMKQTTRVIDTEEKWTGRFWAVVFVAGIIFVFVIFFAVLEKWGCERKKSQGYAGYRNREC